MTFQWFFQNDGNETGPVSPKALLQMARDGQLRPDDLVRRSDMEKWQPASRVKGLEFPTYIEATVPSNKQASDTTTSEKRIIDRAVTENGRTVVLCNDGTWRWDDSDSTTKPTAVSEQTEQSTSLRVAQSGPSSETSSFSFRRIQWGYSEREIRDSETTEPIHELSNAVAYSGSIAELSCQIIYIFARQVCVRAKYAIVEEHANENLYLNDYENLRDLLPRNMDAPLRQVGTKVINSG